LPQRQRPKSCRLEFAKPFYLRESHLDWSRCAICLTEEEQWAKLELAVDIANEVWGK
jgi:hypothetical protein